MKNTLKSAQITMKRGKNFITNKIYGYMRERSYR